MRSTLCTLLAAVTAVTFAPAVRGVEPEPDLRTLRANVYAALDAPAPAPPPAAPARAAVVDGAPANVTVGGAIRRAYVSWEPPAGVEGVTGYRVYRGTTPGALTPVATTAATSYLDRGLATTTYHYAVATMTAAGEGARSEPVAVTVPVNELVLTGNGMQTPYTEGSPILAVAGPDQPWVPVVADGHGNNEASVSPDGTRLAYVSDATGLDGVWVTNADGSGVPKKVAAAGPADGAHNFDEPEWSADGKFLVVRSERPDGRLSSVIFRVSDAAHLEMLEDTWSPSWTAGAAIVAVDQVTGGLVEWKLAAATRTAIPGATDVLDAEVSPDGQTVAFTRVEGVRGELPLTSVRIVPRRGGTATTVVAPDGVSADVTWAPDGSRLYFRHAAVDAEGTMTEMPHVESVLVSGADRRRESNGGGAPAVRHSVTSPRAVAPTAGVLRPDFDGNGVDDVGVFRPSNGTWYVRGRAAVRWGKAGDVPVPADYNGDGRTDVAVYRPSNGTWYVHGRSGIGHGRPGDIPVPADYDGDGDAEIAVFRPSNGSWYVRGRAAVVFGKAGDIPVPGGWLGTFARQMAVYRPSTGSWYFRGIPSRSPLRFGRPGDVPVPLSSGGETVLHDVGIFRPSTGDMYVKNIHTGTSLHVPAYTDTMRAYGSTPMGRMWNRGRGDYVLFQPDTGVWTGLPYGTQPVVLGQRGDVPL